MGENGVAKPPHIFLKFNFFFVNKFYIYFLNINNILLFILGGICVKFEAIG
jgi:hypothetical protein